MTVLGRIRRLWVAVDLAPDMDPGRFRAVIGGARRPTSLDLALIAEAGGVTVDWLLSGTVPRLAAGSPWDRIAARPTKEIRMPTVPTPHDHALPVETLAEKDARLRAANPEPAEVAVPLETGALWNLIDRAERAMSAQEARVLRGCVRVVVERTQRAEARVAALETELARLRAERSAP